tara:strand:+ start:1661 stop:1885 length:225 start_codon:yes stop_codon:yes gene_type:complete
MTTPALERLARTMARGAREDADLLAFEVLHPLLMELQRRRRIAASCREAWQDKRKRARIMEGRRAWLDAQMGAK